ncbi:winged helix-turn-helix transcriptional regulator [Desulfuromonas thiophila]|uniref:winged helix-turn-helix transcriptional regulator n=1 Tax=Desulfuromonas thiophila TaxID=57664 RepID=UPI0014956AC5|nr:response regulator transcription factor [Desulfuromonas thiophila]
MLLLHGPAMESALLHCLEAAGFVVRLCHDWNECQQLCVELMPNLVVADMKSLGYDSVRRIHLLRQDYAGGMLCLVDPVAEALQIMALELGADDVVTRPVGNEMLLARLHALLRRQTTSAGDRIVVDDLSIDGVRRLVLYAGRELQLTTREFDLLLALARHCREVVSRDQLSREVFNQEYNGIDRNVDIYVSRLRSKLRAVAARPALLKTVRGGGYLLGG